MYVCRKRLNSLKVVVVRGGGGGVCHTWFSGHKKEG